MTYTAKQLESILTWLLQLEDRTLSGVVKDLGDGAGLTRFGITSDDVKANGLHGFFNLPKEAALEAAKIYYKSAFWDRMNLSRFDLPLSAAILSCAVNCSPETVDMLLSRSKGATGNYGIESFMAQWSLHYHKLVENHPSDLMFLNGWMNRLEAIYPNLPN